jgi:hypothetical protein
MGELRGVSRPVVDYKILEDEYTNDLADEVKDHLTAGWELWGPPFVLSWTHTVDGLMTTETAFCQAMVKRRMR